MREILFRGKRKDNGKWEEGWYGKYPFGRWPLKDCIVPSAQAESGNLELIEIDPDTVGQYTGLVDKNGVKIFEGDVIFVSASTIPLVIKFINFSWECVRECDGQYYQHRLETDSSKYKVVGNIFDTESRMRSWQGEKNEHETEHP